MRVDCINKTILVFAVCLSALGASARLLPPEVGVGWSGGWVQEWKRDVPGLEISDSVIDVGGGAVKVVRRWTWHGEKPLEKVTLSARYRMKGDSRTLKPFIPGILLYGNPSNKGRRDGRVPVFAGEPDEFAIFEEHRLPMPFALLENSADGAYAALHVLPSPVRGAKVRDLWWSLGVETAADGCDIVIMSGPVGYNRRRSTVKALQNRRSNTTKPTLRFIPVRSWRKLSGFRLVAQTQAPSVLNVRSDFRLIYSSRIMLSDMPNSRK
jgi:hypothetical protein